MSALSKVGMSVFFLLVVRFGGCGSDGCGADEQARTESDRCTGAARWPSADGLGGGRSDAGHPAADPSVVEARPGLRGGCDCGPAAWSAIAQPRIRCPARPRLRAWPGGLAGLWPAVDRRD